ncbi:MAG: CdaR family protein [Candidatus Baltobacteraceae bacterium]
MQIVRTNFALKLLALGLAIVGWAYFRFASNPIVATAEFNQQLSVPIAAVNLPLGYVARFTDHQAVVTVAAKRAGPPIKPEEIKAVLDLSNKGTGVYNVPVQLVAPDLVVQSLSPASVTLTVERIEERSFPITVHYVGAQATGIVVGDTHVNPETATVRAPSSLLARVSALHADVPLPSQPKTLDEMVRPVAVDASGAEVTDLAVSPDLVRVQMNFVEGTAATK